MAGWLGRRKWDNDEMTMRRPTTFLRTLRISDLSKIPMIAVTNDDKSVRDGTRLLVQALGYHASALARPMNFLNPSRSMTHRA